jgi:chlorinating enzyme
VKLKPIHFLLPKSLRNELPIGWNDRMFWVAFKSGGKKLFFDFYCKMREPDSYEPKTKVKAEYQLTEEDIRCFHENGYIGPFDLGYSAEEIEQIKEKLVDLATNQESQIYSYVRGDYELVTRPKGNENGDVRLLSETERASISKLNQLDRYLESSILMDLFKNPAITERCAQVLGPDLLLWHSSFFHISPFGSGTPWHQTSTWLSADMKDSLLQPPDLGDLFQVTCWIPLVDTPKERSCMTMVSGSRGEIYPVKHRSGSGEGNKVFGKYAVDLDYQVDEKNVHFLEAKAGQAIIFCERTVHGSTDNVTEDTRWSVVGRITTPDTRVYTKKMFEDGYELETYGVKKIKLDRWKAVLIRGEDRFGYNKVRSD